MCQIVSLMEELVDIQSKISRIIHQMDKCSNRTQSMSENHQKTIFQKAAQPEINGRKSAEKVMREGDFTDLVNTTCSSTDFIPADAMPHKETKFSQISLDIPKHLSDYQMRKSPSVQYQSNAGELKSPASSLSGQNYFPDPNEDGRSSGRSFFHMNNTFSYSANGQDNAVSSLSTTLNSCSTIGHEKTPQNSFKNLGTARGLISPVHQLHLSPNDFMELDKQGAEQIAIPLDIPTKKISGRSCDVDGSLDSQDKFESIDNYLHSIRETHRELRPSDLTEEGKDQQASSPENGIFAHSQPPREAVLQTKKLRSPPSERPRGLSWETSNALFTEINSSESDSESKNKKKSLNQRKEGRSSADHWQSLRAVRKKLRAGSERSLTSRKSLEKTLTKTKIQRPKRNWRKAVWLALKHSREENQREALQRSQDLIAEIDKLAKHCSAKNWEERGTFTFSVDSTKVKYWEGLMLLVAVYIMMVVPVQIAFDEGSSLMGYEIFDCIIDMLLLMDIVKRFRTTFKDTDTKQEITDPLLIARRYIRGFFIFDALGSIPFQTIIYLKSIPKICISGCKVLRNLKATRLIKLVSFRGTLKHLEETADNPVVLRMANLVIYFTILVHFVSCLYWKALGDHGSDRPFWAIFGESLHFTLGTISGSTFDAYSPEEHYFQSFCFVLGMVINATIIGSATSVISSLNATAVARKTQVDGITELLRAQKIPPHLQKRIRGYFDYLWDIGQSSYSTSMLNELPAKLMFELNLSLKRHLLDTCPLIKTLDASSILYLIQNIQTMVVLPNDLIVKQGEPAEEIFIIGKGKVNVFQTENSQDKYVITLHEGSFFGEMGLLEENSTRAASIVADSFCELLVLKKKIFKVLSATNPQFKNLIQKLNLTRMNNLKKMVEMNCGDTLNQPKMPNYREYPRSSPYLLKQKKTPGRAFLAVRGLVKAKAHKKKTYPTLEKQPTATSQSQSIYDNMIDTNHKVSLSMASRMTNYSRRQRSISGADSRDQMMLTQMQDRSQSKNDEHKPSLKMVMGMVRYFPQTT